MARQSNTLQIMYKLIVDHKHHWVFHIYLYLVIIFSQLLLQLLFSAHCIIESFC